jgi:hypothetical protein
MRIVVFDVAFQLVSYSLVHMNTNIPSHTATNRM